MHFCFISEYNYSPEVINTQRREAGDKYINEGE